jgi:hypothetical protein
VGARQGFFKDSACLGFELRVDGAEDRGDRDRSDAFGFDLGSNAQQFGFVQRRNHATVKLMAAMGEIRMIADRAPEIFGPIDHRRQRRGSWQAEPHSRSLREVPSLHNRVGEMRRADHDHVDRLGIQTGRRKHGLESRHNTRHHVRRRRLLDAGQDLCSIHDDRVSVGAADVNADPHHPALSRFNVSVCLAPDNAASGARR